MLGKYGFTKNVHPHQSPEIISFKIECGIFTNKNWEKPSPFQKVLRKFGTTKVLLNLKDYCKRGFKFSNGSRNLKRSKSSINGRRSWKI